MLIRLQLFEELLTEEDSSETQEREKEKRERLYFVRVVVMGCQASVDWRPVHLYTKGLDPAHIV